MVNNIEVSMDKDFDIGLIYQKIESIANMAGIRLFCIDLDAFYHIPSDIFNEIQAKNYNFVQIYICEGYPCFSIDRNIFESFDFQNYFKIVFKDNIYYLIDESVSGYHLKQYNIYGETGLYIDLDAE